jgi:hypothetical protein
MSEDPEIIPPGSSSMPARRDEQSLTPARYAELVPQPTGLVSSALTRFQAELQARAYGAMADAIKAQAAVLDALTQRSKSQLTLLREVENLREVPDIIALDKAERQAQRIARYDELDEAREERQHQAELARRRRQAELAEADARIADARRDKFNAEQGLENQERLKEQNLELWQTRQAALGLEALDIAQQLRSALTRGNNGAPAPKDEVAQMEAARDAIGEVIRELEADGQDTTELRRQEEGLTETIAALRAL